MEKSSVFHSFCIRRGYKHKWIRRKALFGYFGNNVLYQPNTIPNEPELIKIHDNVRIATGVKFFTHDVINMMFQTMDHENYIPHRSCIEIYDNCFIGGNSVIIGDVSIGPNSIVAAGSVVVKDVQPGAIVGGNPAKVIGSFDDLHEKRKQERGNKSNLPCPDELWNRFAHRNMKE